MSKSYIKKNGFLIRPPKRTFKMVTILFAILVILGLIREIYFKKKIIQYTPLKTIVQVKYDTTKDVVVTFYQATKKQCGNNRGIGASGVKCEIGTCAVSQKLLDWKINYNDTIEILSGEAKGRYRVTDKAASKINVIDIYKPLSYKGSFCYKSDILIKK